MHQEKESGETVTHLSTVEARSGSRTKATRNILAISLILIAAAFIVALAFGFFQTARTGADKIDNENSNINEVR